MTSEVFLMDCMEGMRQYPDNYFDLAVVDPPYGIGIAKNGNVGGVKLAKVKDYGSKNWDLCIPNREYFTELQRASKNQIIWGGNYMIEYLTNTPCFIVWDKNNTGNFADAELAWASFSSSTKIYKYTWNGMLQQNMKDKEHRIHPTQKPVALYDWIFKNYAKEGDKILDTHLGSGSSRISAWKNKLDFTGYEIDEDYFNASEKRFQQFKAQTTLW
jgi:site-specific DNA-methyltransferase (adenine-specific)